MCVPNEIFTELMEFCYKHPRMLVPEGKLFVGLFG